jgi:hypothetical protein
VAVLVICAVLLFFGVDLFEESNNLVISGLTFGALCIAFAVFLMLELGLALYGPVSHLAGRARAGDPNIDK